MITTVHIIIINYWKKFMSFTLILVMKFNRFYLKMKTSSSTSIPLFNRIKISYDHFTCP